MHVPKIPLGGLNDLKQSPVHIAAYNNNAAVVTFLAQQGGIRYYR